MYWIGHKFLSFPTTLTEASQEREIDHAYRMRALLYVILILGEFSHSAAGACILLQRLQEYVGKIPDAKVHALLLLWLSLIGATMSKQGPQRKWFVSYLALFTKFVPVPYFEDESLPVTGYCASEIALGSLRNSGRRSWWCGSSVRDIRSWQWLFPSTNV